MDPGAPFPFGMDPESLRDAPLFRELQRVMASSTGPVNWELARQVGVATAVEDGLDDVPGDEDRRGLDDAVRVAELQVASFTGLAPPGDVAPVRAVRRAEWVGANVESLRALLEPAATRMTDALGTATTGRLPPEAGPMMAMVTQLGPLLHGTQIGQVLGTLAKRVLGQFDLAVPRSGPGELLFIVPNIAAVERDWSLDRTEFRTFVALHEVTHRFEFAQPWTGPHFRELVEDFGSTLTFDIAGLQERFASLDMSDPESMQRTLGDGDSGDGLFGTVLDDEQRIKLGRIQAFMAAAEGYGDHVMHAVGEKLLGSYARIVEAMRRIRETDQRDPVFERLLGIDVKREQYEGGRRFCDAVAERTDGSVLARMWDDAASLPSLPELDEPTLWLSRMV